MSWESANITSVVSSFYVDLNIQSEIRVIKNLRHKREVNKGEVMNERKLTKLKLK